MTRSFDTRKLVYGEAYKVVEKLVNGSFSGATFVRVDQVWEDKSNRHTSYYMDALHKIMTRNDERRDVLSFPDVEVDEGYNPYPRIFVFGRKGESNKRADNNVSKLIRLVKECPFGPVRDRVKIDLKGDTLFDDFLREAIREGSNVLEIGVEPVTYSLDELKNIGNLFLGPRLVRS